MTVTQELDAERFVSLTTFRRTGEPVATPVWITDHDGAPVAFTPAGTGKLKRLAHDPRVQVRPCDRRGRVADSAPTYVGRATMVEDAAQVDRIRDGLREKYGLEFRVFMLVERLLRRGRSARRVGLRFDLQREA